MKRLPWGLILCVALFGYLYADLYLLKGPLGKLLNRETAEENVATFHGEKVTLNELQDALREHLWRHDLSWERLNSQARKDLRWKTLEALIDQRLIVERQQKEEGSTQPIMSLVATEYDFWSRQFEPASDRDVRLGWQHLSAKDMQKRMGAAQVEQAWLERTLQKKSRPITEADLRAWFEEHRESLRQPEAFHAAHLFLPQPDPTTVSREPEIRTIQQKLTRNEANFAELAGQFSEDPRSKKMGGDLGWFSAVRMPRDFMAAVEKMRVGETSAPFRTKLGWHIVKLVERKPSRLPEFDEARSEIEAMLLFRNRQGMIQTLIKDLRSHPGNAAGFILYRPELIDKALPSG